MAESQDPWNPWNAADKLLFNPEVDGFFYWLIQGTPHYGRFTEAERPGRIQHTWMSRSTLGEESMVTMTFHKKEEDTLMTLVHSGLPDTDGGRGHEKGWTTSWILSLRNLRTPHERKISSGRSTQGIEIQLERD